MGRASFLLHARTVSCYYLFMKGRRLEGAEIRQHGLGYLEWNYRTRPEAGGLVLPVPLPNWLRVANLVPSPSFTSLHLASFLMRQLGSLASEAMSLFRLNTLGYPFDHHSETSCGVGCFPSHGGQFPFHTSHISRAQSPPAASGRHAGQHRDSAILDSTWMV